MSLVKWEPFRELEDIQTRLNRLFGSGSITGHDLSLSDWSPAIDVQETDKEYLIKADLPEVKKEDVKVTLQDGVLTIEGDRKLEREDKNKRFHKIERAYGKFVRRFVIPTEIEAAKVQAEFKDGVLNVHLPKSAKATPQSFQVKVA